MNADGINGLGNKRHVQPLSETISTIGAAGPLTKGQDYKRFSSMARCSTHNLCSEMT